MAKKPKLGPDTRILVLCGEEEMLKREDFLALRHALNEAHGAEIDAKMFDGLTAQPAEVFDELRTASFFQPYRLVVVDNADEFIKNHRDLLERYAENPAEGSTLVLRSEKWNSPKFDKLVEKVGAKHKHEAVKSGEATAWIKDRAASHHQRTLDDVTAAMLVDRLGCNLMRLDNELAKLALMVGDGEAIPQDAIRQIVGRGSDDEAWAVQEAVLAAINAPSRSGAADAPGANPAGRIIETIHELVELSDQPDVLVLYFVADLIRKFHLARAMRQSGMSEWDVAGQLKLFRERKDTFFKALNRFDFAATGDMLTRIIRHDIRSKSGYGKALSNLECFSVTLADVLH